MGRIRSVLLCLAFAATLSACGANAQPPLTHPGVVTSNVTAQTGSPDMTAQTAVSTSTHVPTWAYDEYWGLGARGSSAEVRSYVTYAMGGYGNNKAVADCSGSSTCSSVFYIDPNFIYASAACSTLETQSVMRLSGEGWYVHESGYRDPDHRLRGSYIKSCNGSSVTMPVYLLNDAAPSVQNYFRDFLRDGGDSFDYYFMDDTSGEVLTQGYGPGGGFCQNAPSHYCWNSEEYPTNQSVVDAHVGFANNMTHANGSPMYFFFNGVTFADRADSDLGILRSSSRFLGTVCENCTFYAGLYRPQVYDEYLTAMAQVNAIAGKQFVVYNSGDSPSGSAAEISQRLTETAFAWLGYSPGHTSVFEDLEDNTANLAVWPEEGIVPGTPVESMTSSSAQIEVAPGVYRREFSSCSYRGVAIGRCAALVNANSSNVAINATWMRQSYAYMIGLYGGDIASGGKVLFSSTRFVPNSTRIPPYQGVLLVY